MEKVNERAPTGANGNGRSKWREFAKDNEDGLETVEYAILLGLITATVIAAVIAIGTSTRDTFFRTQQILASDGQNDPGGGIGGGKAGGGKAADNPGKGGPDNPSNPGQGHGGG